MTWTWTIEGLGTASQTLTVFDPNGDTVGSETREGWTWLGSYPEIVPELMPTTLEALMALQRGNIEYVENPP